MLSMRRITKYVLLLLLISMVLLSGCLDIEQIEDLIVQKTSAPQVEASALISVDAPVGPSKGKVDEKLTFSLPVYSNVQGEHMYEFDWGDGSVDQTDSYSASHRYMESGVYIVRGRCYCGEIASELSMGKAVMIGKAVLSRTPINLPEHAMYYITPDAPEVQEKVDEILSSTWRKPYTDFGAIREWVSTQISYQYDSKVYGVADYWQLPVETLSLGTGDCEDIAILLCTMLRAAGVNENNVLVAVGSTASSGGAHAYLFEHCTSGMWKALEPQIDPVTSVLTYQLVDVVSTYDYSDDILCFNDCFYFNGAPALPEGWYETELSHCFWPIMKGASVEYARYMEAGEVIQGVVEWYGDSEVMFKWVLNIYGPANDVVLTWDGKDLTHDFMLIASTSGPYRIEIVKRDYVPRCLRLKIDPPGWNIRAD